MRSLSSLYSLFQMRRNASTSEEALQEMLSDTAFKTVTFELPIPNNVTRQSLIIGIQYPSRSVQRLAGFTLSLKLGGSSERLTWGMFKDLIKGSVMLFGCLMWALNACLQPQTLSCLWAVWETEANRPTRNMRVSVYLPRSCRVCVMRWCNEEKPQRSEAGPRDLLSVTDGSSVEGGEGRTGTAAH